MKVLVTGASGFIGHALVPRLIKAGHEVVTSSRHANSGPIGWFHSRPVVLPDYADKPPQNRLAEYLAA